MKNKIAALAVMAAVASMAAACDSNEPVSEASSPSERPVAARFTETPTKERVFNDVLDEYGVSGTNMERKDAALMVCVFLDNDFTPEDIFMSLDPTGEFSDGVLNDDVPYIVGAGVPAFCPRHNYLVEG